MKSYTRFTDYVHTPLDDDIADFVKQHLRPYVWKKSLSEEKKRGWKSLGIPTSKDVVNSINLIQMKLKIYVNLVVSICILLT